MEKNKSELINFRNWIVFPVLAVLVIGVLGVGFAPRAAFAQQATATPTVQAGQATATPQAGQATATPQATAAPQATQQIPQTGQQQGLAPQAETLFRGNVGVFSPSGFDENTFSINRVDRRSVGFQPVNFVGPLLEIESPGRNFPNVLTYVFFNVRSGSIEKQGDRAKGVSIWFRSDDGGDWQQCTNTRIVDDRTATQMGMDINLQSRGQTRVACIATRYNAIYGIGVPRNSSGTVASQ